MDQNDSKQHKIMRGTKIFKKFEEDSFSCNMFIDMTHSVKTVNPNVLTNDPNYHLSYMHKIS